MGSSKQFASNPLYKKHWYQGSKERLNQRHKENAAKKRLSVVMALGGKCNNPHCQWLNEDGSLGCKDIRCLNIDHVLGDGKHERKKPGYLWSMYREILAGNTGAKYQLLCCNCNFIKLFDNKEFRRS